MKTVYAYIDLAFAKNLVKSGDENKVTLLANIMKSVREGNLCFPISIKEKDLLTDFIGEENSPFVIDHSHVFFRKTWELKNNIQRELEKITSFDLPKSFSVLEDDILHPQQRKALEAVSKHPITLLVGGPGTGKSYTAMKLIKSYLTTFPDHKVITTAPTGKALTKLRSKYVKTMTLHLLLGLLKPSDLLTSPLPIDCDLLIVDECSMIDSALFSRLLQSISSRTRVLLMGDPHQLPPVDGGAVFKSLCEESSSSAQNSFFSSCQREKTMQMVHLDHCHRSDRKGILSLSKAILEKDINLIFHLLEDPSLPEISLQSLTYPSHLDSSICYLTPFQKGPFGTTYLNEIIDKASNLLQKPILITKNDYALGLMNGEIGKLENDIASFEDESGKTKVFPLPLLRSYELAYALTVHKSQGSEFPHVALFLPEGSEIFGRSLLYTAVTRAKETLTIFASKEILKACILS